MYLQKRKKSKYGRNSKTKFSEIAKQKFKDETKENEKETYIQKRKQEDEEIDKQFGFERYEELEERIGFLINFKTTSVVDDDEEEWSAVDCYFLDEVEESFKVTLKYNPYFYIAVKDQTENEVEACLRRKYGDVIHNITIEEKEDLDKPNHLSGKLFKYLKISFSSIKNLLALRKIILPLVKKNVKQQETTEVYAEYKDDSEDSDYEEKRTRPSDYMDCIIDIREYDVPYHIRVAIDCDLRAGNWYKIKNDTFGGNVTITPYPQLVKRPNIRVCAFDIETTKQPLKFPDPKTDIIMMISYMIDGQGYLIVNREIVAEDIEDFEYKGNDECHGEFIVFNEENERAVLETWFNHLKETKPIIYATFNGDAFDWPFIDERAKINGMNMRTEIGYWKDLDGDYYRSTFSDHMDCYHWVRRDSYLPQGSHGLKAVAKIKLGYDPIEINPEEMVPLARENPTLLASYSVSDAVATYFLYMKYVHPFIFSLCTIIPMPPDAVLRKGTGTLCEMLLMVEAFRANIICPNKHKTDPEKMYKGHLIESETYVGGHVECLQSGIFRSDLKYKFDVDPNAYQQLIDKVDEMLKFAIEVEEKVKLEDIVNYEQNRNAIIKSLNAIKNEPKMHIEPKIYHLDVGAMYPNIILTNRLQPTAIVNEDICAACVHNKPENNCKRVMPWQYRVKYFQASAADYRNIKNQLASESFPPKHKDGEWQKFSDLPEDQKRALIKKRLSSLKGSTRTYKETIILKKDTVCMREHPFYVNTVQSFRDRRMEYKNKAREWKKKSANAEKGTKEAQEAMDMVIIYDSLQLAHKCILNSFYGYVMRRGARWYSMEMAGIVTHYGASIIKMARELVEKVGITLELDTDGIWCMLPATFPENFQFKTKSGKSITISYPCVMLNYSVARNFTNHQYQELVDAAKRIYKTESRCSIFFEVDGPYRAMILPASQKEGSSIKKRYAVFNMDGSLAELKGFELKRRGELNIIKHFQEKIFSKFLLGKTLEECYQIVGAEADIWLDILYYKGKDLDSRVLFEYITEKSNMSKSLKEYGDQKSSRITTAKRLGELLGTQVVKDEGLTCKYVISAKPENAKVTERAIPVEVFEKEPKICLEFLRKWTKDKSLNTIDVKEIIDWDYYIERLSSAIQKIITIPAALQNVKNPVPRVQQPSWIVKQLHNKSDGDKKQMTLDTMFTKMNKENDKNNANLMDIEDIVDDNVVKTKGPVITKYTKKRRREEEIVEESEKISTPPKEPPKHLQNMFTNPSVKLDSGFFDSKEFDNWLDVQKDKWRELRNRKKKRRTGVGLDLTEETSKSHTSVSSFLRQQNLALKHSQWQILQIRETDVPGTLRLFIMIGNIMQTVNIQVPRRIYINFREKPKSAKSDENIVRTLPRSRPTLYLYERELSEVSFQENSKALHEYLTDPNIEGVYESRVPLVFRSVMQLGCVCAVRMGAKDKVGTNELSIDDLAMQDKFTYLETDLRKVYIYHSLVENRGIITIYFMNEGTVNVYIIQPFVQAEKPHFNFERLSKELYPELTTFPKFKQNYVSSLNEGYKSIQRDLEEYQQRRGPTMVITQTPLSMQDLLKKLSSLQEFPTMQIAFHTEDAKYPAIQWIPFCVNKMLTRLYMVEDWYNDIVKFARFTKTPIGNIDKDFHVYMMDILYARYLNEQNHLLWAHEGSKPDLGGLEEDDHAFLLEDSVTKAINHSGCYHSVSVEIEMTHLITNTMVQSKFINEIEGTEGFAELHTSKDLVIYDESILCREAFNILKNLISFLFKEAGKNNPSADELLGHFYRWLTNPHSKLYDPALTKMINTLMNKVFLQLLANIKKLGGKIVFANFHKIIINTPKYTKEDAKVYVEYLIRTLRKKKLFVFIDLEIKKYYDNLLWMDSSNYAGIVAKEPKKELEVYWNIVEYLPSIVQKYVILCINEYLFRVHKEKHKFIESNDAIKIESIADHLKEFAQHYINNEFTKTRLHDIEQIQNDFSRHAQNFEFPKLPGSYLTMHQPSLETIKTICHVLSLDKLIKHEVVDLKKNLLKLIQVRDFSKEAKFQNPCRTFILPNVICEYCNSCRDLDLCRDKNILNHIWKCNDCGQAYDKEWIEGRIVEIVQKRIVTYQVQDLKCIKCGIIASDNMSTSCSCSGEWKVIETPKEIKILLKTLSSIAQYHKFEWLGEIVEFLLQNM